MDMKAFWSGFATAVALVLLAATATVDEKGVRILVAGLTAIVAVAATGFAHDARRVG